MKSGVECRRLEDSCIHMPPVGGGESRLAESSGKMGFNGPADDALATNQLGNLEEQLKWS